MTLRARRCYNATVVALRMFPGAHAGRVRGERDRTLSHVYALFPVLGERRTQLAGSLSGEEQQMCAIGRALMARPRVLMLDEPTLGPAPVLVAKIFETVSVINGEGVRHSPSPTAPAFWRVDGWSFKAQHATCRAMNVSSVRI